MARAEVGALTGRELVERHVRAFNDGVRTGDWSLMLERFASDAELRFEGGAAPPAHGIDEIRAAYRDNPPDDVIVLLGVQENDEHTVVAAYAWSRGGTGRMVVQHRDGSITGLTVVFD